MSPLDWWILAISIPVKTQVTGRVVGVCLVLRDTPYFPALKVLLDKSQQGTAELRTC